MCELIETHFKLYVETTPQNFFFALLTKYENMGMDFVDTDGSDSI